MPESSLASITPDGFEAIVVSLTLRNILLQVAGREFLFSSLTQQNFQDLLDGCIDLLKLHIQRVSAFARGLPVFFNSFLEPSFSYDGLLIRNPYSAKAFLAKLNEAFADQVSHCSNCYVMDMNEILSWVGRAHTQDDTFTASAHNSLLWDWNVDFDGDRIEAAESISKLKDARAHDELLSDAYWKRLCTAVNILRQVDPIKLIIVDLDDTLWRGISGEVSVLEKWKMAEGWPLGVLEALLFFKRRGGLLAICSKNDYDVAIAHMDYVYDGNLVVEDFVSVKINRLPKPENIRQILADTNLLEDNVLYVDDNPREIEEVSRRFPGIRTLSGNPYRWREIILRAAETQSSVITAESTNRTKSLRALLANRQQAASIDASDVESRQKWLQSLGLEQRICSLNSTDSNDFERCFELLNKTNQFNTTGLRWLFQDVKELFSRGGSFVYTSLKDRLVDNGIVGLAIVLDEEIKQMVLSCRVFGLGVEAMLLSAIVDRILGTHAKVVGRVVDTGKNFACHNCFKDLGFVEVAGSFEITQPVERPSWIDLVEDFGADQPHE